MCESLSLSLVLNAQHEVDHLNGILATERKVEDKDLTSVDNVITREAYLRDKSYYDSHVDYAIQ